MQFHYVQHMHIIQVATQKMPGDNEKIGIVGHFHFTFNLFILSTSANYFWLKLLWKSVLFLDT